MNDLPHWYDSWRLDNGEPDSFTCDVCQHEYRLNDYDEEFELCKYCAEKEKENAEFTSDFRR